MKNKLLKLLLEEDVIFREVDPEFCNTKGYTLQGFSCMFQHVLGNSKEEILQKMYDIKQEKNRKIKKYYSLTYEADFLQDIKNGKPIQYNREYTVRKAEKTDHFHLMPTETKLGKDWLKSLFYDMYFEVDYTKGIKFTDTGFSFLMKRNNLEIDNSFWGKHEKLVKEWLAYLD